MNNNHNNNSFHQKQREMFARMLAKAKEQAQAQAELESQSLDDKVNSELLPKLAEERGAIPLIKKLRTLRKEVDDAEKALEHLGFDCDEDSISLKWDAPKDLEKAVEAAKHALEKERNAALRKYDLGIVAVWATEDIQKVERSLRVFCKVVNKIPIPSHSSRGIVMDLSLTRRGLVKVDPESQTMNTNMAWRPYSNLIDGELDDRTPGKVAGWIRFFRSGKRPLKVVLDLAGDFHEDIRGKVIRLSNPEQFDKNHALDREGTYMDGFARMQQGEAGDITAGLSLGPWTAELAQRLIAQHEIVWDERGLPASEREAMRQELAENFRQRVEAGDLYYPYVPYPYIEWYSEANGRVVLELEPSQVEILDGEAVPQPTRPAEDAAAGRKRAEAFGNFFNEMIRKLSDENRKQGNDTDVTGVVVE